MSRPWLGSEREGGIASLACMRAALEAATGARGAGGALLKLGVEVPEMNALGKYEAWQFKPKHLAAAKRRVALGPEATENDRYRIEDHDYLTAWDRFQNQEDTIAERQRLRAAQEAKYFAPKRPRPAIEIDDGFNLDTMPEDLREAHRRAHQAYVDQVQRDDYRLHREGRSLPRPNVPWVERRPAGWQASGESEWDWLNLDDFDLNMPEAAPAPKRRRRHRDDGAMRAWENRR